MSRCPLVSVVTPAYNQCMYVGETIESVLAQDYPYIEYIVLDDGSTDGTAEILQRYSDRLRWETHKNMGQARTLNKGWSMSNGEILAYLSSDDLLKPTAVREAVNVFTARSRVVVTYSDYELIDGRGQFLRSFVAEEFDKRRLTQDLVCQPGPGAFFRKSIFVQTGGWRGELAQTPDFDFWLRASAFGDFQRIPKQLASCRVHFQSASMRPISSARADEIIEVVTDHWKALGTNCDRALAKAYVLAAKLHMQSGRYSTGVARYAAAARMSPTTALSKEAVRALLAGSLRRVVHAAKGRR